MAISTRYQFDYEVILHPDCDGVYTGIAQSLQAKAGSLPGLAGRHPRVTVALDALLVEASEAEAPPNAFLRLWEFIPVLRGRYLARYARSAAVRAFSLPLPSAKAWLAPGTRIRLTHSLLAPLGQPMVASTRILIVTPDGERREHAVTGLGPVPW